MAPAKAGPVIVCHHRRKWVTATVFSLFFTLGIVSTSVVAELKAGKSEKHHKKISADGVELNTHRDDLLPAPADSVIDENADYLPPASGKFKNALIIVGPSASGKTTLANRLMADLGDQIYMLARHTSRLPRAKEVNGTDYVFIKRQEILASLKNGEFITISELADNIYGISKESLRDCVKASTREGKLCMTEMMVSAMVLDALHMVPELNAVYVFIRTPNITVMEQRLRHRKTETDDAILSRVHQAKADMSFCDNKRHLIDYCLTNNDLEYTYRRMKDIVRAEFPFVTFPGDADFDGENEDIETAPADTDLEAKEKVHAKKVKWSDDVAELRKSQARSKKESKKAEKRKKGAEKDEL